MVQEQSATQTSVSGLPLDMNNPTVNRRRERRIYYRPHYDKKGEFIGYYPTLPLPSDPWHMNYYVNKKGFKLWPPGEEPKGESLTKATIIESRDNAITCPVEGCNKIVNSFLGLARHMAKVHNKK